MDTPYFTQEGIGTVDELIQTGDLLCKKDLENGFQHAKRTKHTWGFS